MSRGFNFPYLKSFELPVTEYLLASKKRKDVLRCLRSEYMRSKEISIKTGHSWQDVARILVTFNEMGIVRKVKGRYMLSNRGAIFRKIFTYIENIEKNIEKCGNIIERCTLKRDLENLLISIFSSGEVVVEDRGEKGTNFQMLKNIKNMLKLRKMD